MRPVSLSISAFGPFAHSELIHFDRLGNNPLFLINGPTGSGKTTILDAICYALYGETTGNERQGKEMRCDRASTSELTEVILVFKLADQLYKIRRVPEQERAKTRGDGVTSQLAEAQLWRIENSGQEMLLVPRKVGEANTRVMELTGLSADQFRQVMVLPQGKFRDLLLADSQEREGIFQQLFQTHVYTHLEDRLRSQALSVSTNVKQLVEKQKAILETIDIESVEALNGEIESHTQQIQQASEEKKATEKCHAQSLDRLQKAQQIQQLFEELSQATEQLSILDAEKTGYEEKQHSLKQAKAANHINSKFDALQQITAECAVAAQDETKHLSVLESAKQGLKQAEVDQQQVESQKVQLESHKQQLLTLQSYRERSDQLFASTLRMQHAEKELQKAALAENLAEQKLVQLQKNIENLQSKLQENQDNLHRLPEKQLNLEHFEKRLQKREMFEQHNLAVQTLEERISKGKSVLLQSSAALKEATRQRKIMENAWQNGQAALLAQQLTEGQACSVCGSLDHPSPASYEDGLPTQDDLENTRLSEEKASSESENAKQLMMQLNTEELLVKDKLHELEKELDGMVEQDIIVLKQQRESDKNDIKGLLLIQSELAKQQQQLSQLNDQEKNEKLVFKDVHQRKVSCENDLAATETDHNNKQAELPEQYRAKELLESAIRKQEKMCNDLQSRINKIEYHYQQMMRANVSAQTALDAARNNVIGIDKKSEKAQQDWQSHLLKSPFENDTEFTQACLSITEQGEIEKELREYEDKRLRLINTIEKLQKSLQDKSSPDIKALSEAENDAKIQLNKVSELFHQLQARQNILTDAVSKLEKSQREQQKLEKRFAVIGTLNDIANGNNAHKMSLHRFVLSVLLDDVLIKAGCRLNKMSKGRYQLLRREDVTDARKKSGLELEVADAYTGKQRSVATLSGGESFMAALSLALGLSDVVQAYAGGIRLDALFIDEGFGSLDSDALDLAINTLIELQASGRMVGVISHVPELKERIDVRLDLICDQHGSHTHLHVP